MNFCIAWCMGIWRDNSTLVIFFDTVCTCKIIRLQIFFSSEWVYTVIASIFYFIVLHDEC